MAGRVLYTSYMNVLRVKPDVFDREKLPDGNLSKAARAADLSYPTVLKWFSPDVTAMTGFDLNVMTVALRDMMGMSERDILRMRLGDLFEFVEEG